MNKICIFTLYDTKGASSKYRIIQFVEPLSKEFDVFFSPFWNNEYATKYMHNKRKYFIPITFFYLKGAIKRLFQLLCIAPKADIVFFQKTCIPKSKINLIKGLRKKGIKIVFDIDDAVYIYDNDCSKKIASLSDLVICGNETLWDYYSKYCSNSIIIPTVENTLLFERYYQDTFTNKKIGWIGNQTTIANLEIVVEAINTVISHHPEVSFDIISNTALDYPDRIKNCRLIQWSENDYFKYLADFSIGIMPLADNEFNRGKCGFKLVQYLNMKKPVVASDIGVNRDIVGESGLLANTVTEWIESLEVLLFDRSLYNKCIRNIEDEFLNRYHFSSAVNMLVSSLKDLLN